MKLNIADRNWFRWPLVGNVIRWSVCAIHLAALTVRPFMRVPGSAGAGYYEPGAASIVCLGLLLTACASGRQLALVFAFCVLSVGATLGQYLVARLVRTRPQAVPQGYRGRSVAQLIFPRADGPGRWILGEAALCAAAGGVAHLLCGSAFLAGWLVVVGVCSGVSYLLEEPSACQAVDVLAKDQVFTTRDGRRVRRVQCRVVA